MNDYGKSAKPRQYHIDAFDFNGKADKRTNADGYADNIMPDHTGVNEGDNTHLLIQLRSILNDECDLDDDAISRSPRLSASAIGKLGIRFGISAPKVQKLVLDLVNSIMDDTRKVNEAMDDINAPRYSFEQDTMGNMIIRDSITGESKKLLDQDAHSVKDAIDRDGGNEQEILHNCMHETSDLKESELEDIGGDLGTYNFPWYIAGQNGTATGRFSGSGKSFTMDVISIRDMNGREIDVSETMRDRINKIGMEFIAHA